VINPSTITKAPAHWRGVNRSLSSQTPKSAANSTEVSLVADTMAMGAAITPVQITRAGRM